MEAHRGKYRQGRELPSTPHGGAAHHPAVLNCLGSYQAQMAAGAAPPCPASRSSAERARAKREIGVAIAESPPAVSGRECGRCREQRLGLIHEALVTAAISAAKQPRCLSTTSPGPPMPQNAAKDEKGEGRTSRQDGDEDQAVEMLPEHSTGPCRLRRARCRAQAGRMQGPRLAACAAYVC